MEIISVSDLETDILKVFRNTCVYWKFGEIWTLLDLFSVSWHKKGAAAPVDSIHLLLQQLLFVAIRTA